MKSDQYKEEAHTVANLLKRRILRSASEFSDVSEKDGAMAGYIGEDLEDHHQYMMKTFSIADPVTDELRKSPMGILRDAKVSAALYGRVDAVNELVASTIMNIVLPQRSPEIAIVASDDADQLMIRSKFLFNAITLEQYLVDNGLADDEEEELSEIFDREESSDDFDIEHDIDNDRFSDPAQINFDALNKINGFEKILAACCFIGDVDFHGENLLITQDGMILKVDHGKAFSKLIPNNIAELESMISTAIENFGYENITFDLKKFIDSLELMAEVCTKDMQYNIIDRKVDELQNAGLQLGTWRDYKGAEGAFIQIQNEDELKVHYKEFMAQNMQNIASLAQEFKAHKDVNVSHTERIQAQRSTQHNESGLRGH